MDQEPHRCRRTNGEKWRCSRDVLPGQKFCDRHVYRSRKSSSIPTPAADGDMNITKPKRGGRPKGSKNKTKGMSSDKSNGTSINSNLDDAPPPPPLVFESRKVVQPMDPEPGRCWRNDGHRWRCYKDVLPGQKYCEHHFNYRDRKSSRIPAAAAVGDTNITKPNRGGRPKGSKNRIKGMSFDKSNGTSINSNMDDAPPPPPPPPLDGVAEGGSSSEMRLGGDSWLKKRPINKPLRFCDADTDKQIKPKRGGRPMGSKNRVKGSTNKSHGTNSDINDDLGANNIKKKKKTEDESVKQIFIRSDSSYLITLGQTHSGWIFGAIAELVDNARDAKATKVEIFVEYNYSKKAGEMIPMLSVIDDGHGMSHQEVLALLSFGNKRSVTHDDHDRLGRFGIGFKTGSMKLGRDVILLSQTTESRSIAFLSQSVNADKDNLVTPVVSFSRKGTYMEVDTSIQSKASAAFHLKPIKAFSPFNKYFIGEKLGLFGKNGQGTQIYIWNLDKWGSDFSLEWQKREKNTPSEKDDDILIRSRRIRSRPGQISQKVPLDYSLRSYLEVIFLNPRMKIYVQGSLVNCRPLAKSLNNTKIYNGEPVMGKPVQLTLGRSQQEWERRNCGIFLYWHGRLIEAYKRVGAMINNPDVGRGVIGVIDVSDYMRDGDVAHVHNTKQSFLDIELYAELEKWLGTRADEYWDDHFDTLPCYKPDNEWVQCEKCRKWRMLSSDFDTTSLPQEWFCCMRPYNGECETPEEEIQPSAVTVDAETSEEELEPEPVKVGSKRSRSNDRKGGNVAVYVRGRHVLQGTSKCK